MKSNYEKYQDYLNRVCEKFKIDSIDLKNLNEFLNIVTTPSTLSILKKIFLKEWFTKFHKRINKIMMYSKFVNSESNEKGIIVDQPDQNPRDTRKTAVRAGRFTAELNGEQKDTKIEYDISKRLGLR